MFKLISSIVIYTLFASTVQVKGQRIPDPKFAQAIKWACPNCIDTINTLTPSAYNLNSLTLLNDITDLTGIDAFVNLTSLNCADNKLTSLPNLPPFLRTLYCGNNKLKELNNLPKNLILLNCHGNQLKILPTLPGNLQTLDCSNNQLTGLPKLPTSLTNLYCSYNNLTSLPPLPSLLSTIGCAYNKLTTLPDLPKTLILLSCFENPLIKCLPTLPDSLKFLEISSTITCLPNPLPKTNIFLYTGQDFRTATLPSCSIAVTSPCYVSALNSFDLNKKILLYPSPTEGVFFVESDNTPIERIQIFNNTSQMIQQVNNNRIDITAQASGIYFLKIDFKGFTILKKVVKK
jgi:Leucine-rich repeat (LRR) protein